MDTPGKILTCIVVGMAILAAILITYVSTLSTNTIDCESKNSPVNLTEISKQVRETNDDEFVRLDIPMGASSSDLRQVRRIIINRVCSCPTDQAANTYLENINKILIFRTIDDAFISLRILTFLLAMLIYAIPICIGIILDS
jgi:hypothetical protein